MLLSLFYGAIDRRVYKQVLNKEIRKKTILKETQDIHSKMKKKKDVYIRAIRIRTVDLLGKTDQTDYYRNDSNCFKDPTCIFFSALGSFIN
jgi:hypothetical protein